MGLAPLAAGAAAAVILLSAAPASAAPAASPGQTADLYVSISNKSDAVAGQRVSYQVVVRNRGPLPAVRVQIDFTTTAPLSSIEYTIGNGHCYRSPQETACLFYSTLPPGHTATATITGIMPHKIAQDTVVTNRVVVASSTPLANPRDDTATDVYRMDVPRAVVKPVASPTPSIDPSGKLAKITNTASKWMGYSSRAVRWTFIILGAGIAWFAIGLLLRRRRRLKLGDDEVDFEEDEPDPVNG
jgi:hypothetical protein